VMAGFVARLRAPSRTSQPPAPGELWRNDLAVLVTVLFALFLGLGIRNGALTAQRSFALGAGLPTIAYPAGWHTDSTEALHFQAINPASASSFDARLAVSLQEGRSDQSLDLARAAWALRRSQELMFYRELAAEPVTVLDGQPALRTRFAFVADPTRAQGATGLPVVVEAEDLLFLAGDQLVVISVAADATQWREEARHFGLVYDSLKVRAATDTGPPAPPTPIAATPPVEGDPE
jgi:hypothetical protein